MLPPLWLLPIPQRMTAKEEETFWCGLDLKTREELEQGVLPPDIQIEDGWLAGMVGAAASTGARGSTLLAFGGEAMEVEGGTK